ncbi:sigma factor-like helix-turn-helix DNA-binding protein [Sporosalibacterium faouarense]|uniref:sigma factor-like helix-turn-helix DNA-binding protein n=1 Tax=Sporosalibacterium faouarense TaxID=516123 RepID=UPI00192C8ABD|nr:sigma factor-like helix-turn-helix DNA-binding protein [Sporosalibacterium faouarense]
MTKWNSWAKNHKEYKKSLGKLSNFIEVEKNEPKNNSRDVNLEIARSMKSGLKEAEKAVKNKAIYEFNSLDEEEIKDLNLTDRQREIAILRQSLSYEEIADKLKMKRGAVYDIYTQVLKKFDKYKNDKEVYLLSNQQKEIYKLCNQGKTKKEIANSLNTTPSAIKTQLNRIKRKLMKEGNKITCIRMG